MNLIDRLLGPNTELAILVMELFEQLPDSSPASNGIDPDIWNSALLDPARDILGRSGKGLRARLLERCFDLAGGDHGRLPEMLPVLIELLHAGSLIIDDIEDDSPMRRGEPALHRRFGLPIALNTGNWFYFLPLALLSRADLDNELRLALYQDTSLALLRCHKGQALDLSVNVASVKQGDLPALVAKSTRLKTGSLMELAAIFGVRAAGAPASKVEAFARFGGDLGVGLQMLDDWSSINVQERHQKGVEDITLGRPTWPWAWLAQSLDESRFSELVSRAGTATTRQDASFVMDRIRGELSATAAGRIRRHLEKTLDGLRPELGPSADMQPLIDDIEELERAYG